MHRRLSILPRFHFFEDALVSEGVVESAGEALRVGDFTWGRFGLLEGRVVCGDWAFQLVTEEVSKKFAEIHLSFINCFLQL